VKRICILAIVLVFLPSALYAGDGTVNLKEAIQLALRQNNLLKAAEYESSAARYGLSASRSRFFPRIYLDENFAASNSPTRVFMMKLDEGRFTQNDFLIDSLNHPSSATDFRTAFTLEQPLFDMGIVYGTRLAAAEADEKKLVLEGRREDIGFTVFSSYLEVQKARRALDAAEKAVSDAHEHVRLAKVRNEAGTGLKSDELRALTYLAEMEEREISAKNDLTLAGMRLSLATGGKPGDSLGIREPVTDIPLALDPEEILSLALKKRKDLQITEKEKEKASVGVKMATSSFLPTLNGTATYQMNDRDTPFSRDNDAWIVGANLRWELFDGMRRVSDRARAKALHNSARQYQEQQTKEIALQVRESLLRRDEAVKKLQVARSACLTAEEGLRLIEKRFAGSLATLVEVLDAQTALNTARVNVVETEAGYLLATARVWHTAGIFLKEVMK
jgi:outer membrane protein